MRRVACLRWRGKNHTTAQLRKKVARAVRRGPHLVLTAPTQCPSRTPGTRGLRAQTNLDRASDRIMIDCELDHAGPGQARAASESFRIASRVVPSSIPLLGQRCEQSLKPPIIGDTAIGSNRFARAWFWAARLNGRLAQNSQDYLYGCPDDAREVRKRYGGGRARCSARTI